MSEIRRATWSGLDGRLVLGREQRLALQAVGKSATAGTQPAAKPSLTDGIKAAPGATAAPKRDAG